MTENKTITDAAAYSNLYNNNMVYTFKNRNKTSFNKNKT